MFTVGNATPLGSERNGGEPSFVISQLGELGNVTPVVIGFRSLLCWIEWCFLT